MGFEVAIQIGVGHEAFDLDVEDELGKISCSMETVQIFEVLAGQESAFAQAPVVRQLHQELVLGPVDAIPRLASH